MFRKGDEVLSFSLKRPGVDYNSRVDLQFGRPSFLSNHCFIEMLSGLLQSSGGNEAGIEDIADADTEEALAEFNFLVSENNEGAGEAQSQGDNVDWGKL